MRLLFPDRLPFQHISLIRQLAIAGSCAVTHFGSILSSAESAASKVPDEKEYATLMQALAAQSERNLEAAKVVEAELAGMMALEVRAVVEGHKLSQGDPRKPPKKEDVDRLRSTMNEAMVEVSLPFDL